MSRPLSFFLRPKSDVERAAFEAYQRLLSQRAYAGGGIGPKDVRRTKSHALSVRRRSAHHGFSACHAMLMRLRSYCRTRRNGNAKLSSAGRHLKLQAAIKVKRFSSTVLQVKPDKSRIDTQATDYLLRSENGEEK